MQRARTAVGGNTRTTGTALLAPSPKLMASVVPVLVEVEPLPHVASNLPGRVSARRWPGRGTQWLAGGGYERVGGDGGAQGKWWCTATCVAPAAVAQSLNRWGA